MRHVWLRRLRQRPEPGVHQHRAAAARMSCEPSNATFVVDKLEKLGLLERHPHPDDRRAKQLVLTADGASLRERLLAIRAEDSPLAGLTREQQSALQDLLRRAVAR